MEDNKKLRTIDFERIFEILKTKKKVYLWAGLISFVLSCIWIFPEPRYYDCDVALAPEANEESLGGLSSIASSFGFDLGSIGGADAIYPLLYPDLFESPEFLVGLFDIKVKSLDGEIATDYYSYLKDYQKQNMLLLPFKRAFTYIQKLFEKEEKREGMKEGSKLNSFLLSKKDYMLMEKVKDKISCSVDKKTNVISIVVRDQDPLVCATMADSVKEHLQNFIIQYRTSKARQDCAYYQHLTDSAKAEYEEALRRYSEYSDTHKDVILQAYISERDKLENDMSEKYNTYNLMNTQLQAMKAKVQERTPSFTTLKSATVPVKPTGPKRMIFVLGMVFLVFVVLSIYYLRGLIYFR